MADIDSDSWPKTAAGTIDWEWVFENPESGILRMIAAAQTARELRGTATMVIQALFARKNDTDEVARLTSELNELIPDEMPAEQIAPMVAAVTSTLRGIKEFRTQKAREYEKAEAEKAAQPQPADKAKEATAAKAAADRRKAEQKQASIKAALVRRRKQRLYALVGLGAIIVLGAAGGGTYWLTRGPELPENADQILLQQMRFAATGIGVDRHVFGGRLRTQRNVGEIAVIAERVPQSACLEIGLRLSGGGTLSINGEIPRTPTQQTIQALCAAAGAAGSTLSWISPD